MKARTLALAGLMTIAATTSLSAGAADLLGTIDFPDPLYTLQDLDLNDGVEPLLKWTPQTSGVSILGSGGSSIPDWTTPLLVQNAISLASATSGLTPAMGFIELGAARYGDFTLTANTKVVFTLPAAVAAGSPAGVDILLGASIYAVGDFGASFVGDDLSATNGESKARNLSVFFQNTTAGTINGHFSSSLNVNAAPALLIPEPQAYALIIVGLGLVGIAARRRKTT